MDGQLIEILEHIKVASMDSGSRGLLRLMVRFPALRGELQIVFGHDEALQELSEAYEVVARMLEQLRGDPRAEGGLVKEYEELRLGIETDVLQRCSSLQ